MDRTSLTRNLQPPARKKWIRIAPGDEDRRVRMVSITPCRDCGAPKGAAGVARRRRREPMKLLDRSGIRRDRLNKGASRHART